VIPLGYVAPTAAAVDVGETVERFDRFLAVANRSTDTRRLYTAAVRRWLLAGGMPGHVDHIVLGRFLAARRDALAVASMNIEIKALRAFYRCQEALGSAPAGSVGALPKLRKEHARAPRWLTDEEVGQVLGCCPLQTFVGLRDYAMLLTLYATGLRSGELAAMQLGDFIDDDALFVHGKGGHHRYVPTGRQLAGVLNGYLHARAQTRPGKRNAFWLRQDGTPLRGRREVWEITSRRIRAVLDVAGGVDALRAGGRPWSGFYPHQLRASFASALLQNGMPLTAIAQLMGHADISTTARYLGLEFEHLKRAVGHHPRALRRGD
jgi:integrase/recombinase XerD